MCVCMRAQVFRFLRHTFEIDDDVYTDSLSGSSNKMIERYTEGRSSSWFYFSENGTRVCGGKKGNP